MRKKTLNKLVRDKIPLLMMRKGQKFQARCIEGQGLQTNLALKLKEESKEVFDSVLEYQAAQGGINTYNIECEIGDLLEVVFSLMKTYNLTSKRIKSIMDKKREERGSFKEGIYLEWVEDLQE